MNLGILFPVVGAMNFLDCRVILFKYPAGVLTQMNKGYYVLAVDVITGQDDSVTFLSLKYYVV